MNEEDIKKLALALKGSDHDSFAALRGGLKDNWIFLGAIIVGVMWIFNNFNAQSAVNIQQDGRIDVLTQNVTQLTASMSSLVAKVEVDNKNQTQIQQDIALIKADISTIKESVK